MMRVTVGFFAVVALPMALSAAACFGPNIIVDPCGEPVAVAEAVPTDGDAPVFVRLLGDRSLCQEGLCEPIQFYAWDFDNGRTSNQANDTVTYETPAIYRPYLRVGACQLEDTAFVTITVR